MDNVMEMISTYGISLVIVGLFIYDWITNKKSINDTLDTVNKTVDNMNSCLEELKTSNNNISKSLDILSESMSNQTNTIEKIYDKVK